MQIRDLNLLKWPTDFAKVTVTMVTFREIFKIKKKNKKNRLIDFFATINYVSHLFLCYDWQNIKNTYISKKYLLF